MSESFTSSFNRSIELINTANLKEALALLRSMTQKYPGQEEPLVVLGELLMQRDDSLDEAIECFQKSLLINNKNPTVHLYLGLVYERFKDYKAAFESYRNAVMLDENYSDALHSIGRLLKMDKQNVAALHYMTRAYQSLSEDLIINSDLAFVCNTMGMTAESIRYYIKCLELEPQNKNHLSSLIFLYHKDPSKSLEDLYDLAKKYYHDYIDSQKDILKIDHSSRYDPGKTILRLGFVSADFRTHPVAYNLLSVFQRLNKQDFEIYLYYNDVNYDSITTQFQNLANKFVDIKNLTDIEAARTIAQDSIDILFDLSGFTYGERLEIFKHKPAPVQASHLGFFGTLGIPEIDFLLADNCVVQEGEEKFYTEQIYKFASCYNHCDLYNIPESQLESPCLKNGYVTFGSFNTFHKISREVIDTWIELLLKTPNSKILFDSRSMQAATDIQYYKNLFVQKGIAPERLLFRANVARQDFLNSYNDIDISLDPFPYTGGTTTLESLLMGVPVVTIMGDKWSGRLSSTTLLAINHGELIAKDKEEYLAKLIELAGDTSRISNYRKNLKQDMLNSELHIDKYVVNFEKALKDIWQIKCSQQNQSPL